jgi:excisionase family DNA binding protein
MTRDQEFVSVNEVSKYLGVTPNTLYSWRRRGVGPRTTPSGRSIRYTWSDVDAWVTAQASIGGRGPAGAAARVIAASGMPSPARTEVIVPPRTWTFIPGTRLQVHHEASHLSWCDWCELHKDGSLTLGDPYDRWSTRMAP